MRISDWSSDVCSSDLHPGRTHHEDRRIFRSCPNRWRRLPRQSSGGEVNGADPCGRAHCRWRWLRPERFMHSSRSWGLIAPGGAPSEHFAPDRKSTRLPVTNAHLVCRLLLEKKTKTSYTTAILKQS